MAERCERGEVISGGAGDADEFRSQIACGTFISRPSSILNLQRRSNSDLAQYSHTPILYHCARPDSRTACPTKPTLYIAIRSRSAAQVRRAPQ